MANQQILDYIKQQLRQGINKEDIKKSLLSSGWQNTDVEDAFNVIMMPANSKKRKWKKIVLIIGVFIIFVFLFFYFLPSILNIFSRDIAEIDDSDLRLQVVSIPESNNAYFDLIKLDNIIYEPEGKSDAITDIAAGKIWDEKLVEEIISKNSQAYEYFSNAARRISFQDPAFADPFKTLYSTVTPMNSWRKMSRFSAIRAMYLAKQGSGKDPLEEALNSVKIGQKIQDSQATMIEYLVALYMKENGLVAIQNIVSSTSLNNDNLNPYIQELNQYYNNENGFIAVRKGEYLQSSQMIDALVHGDKEVWGSAAGINDDSDYISKKLKNNYYLRPNKTKALYAEHARTEIKNVNQCSGIKTTNFQILSDHSPIKLYITENAIGKLLYDLSSVSASSIIQKKCNEDLLVASTQLLLALKVYKNNTGDLPASLDQLTPQYLQNIPADPFDNKTIKYSQTNKIIYSVGEDSVDSGGSTGEDWKQMPDPTFNIKF